MLRLASVQCPVVGNQKNQSFIMKKTLLLAAVLGVAVPFATWGGGAPENWATLCAKCHGAEGKGDTKIGAKLGCKDLSDAQVQAGLKDDGVAKAIKEGVKSAEGKSLMKPFNQLSDEEVQGLVAYIRGFKK